MYRLPGTTQLRPPGPYSVKGRQQSGRPAIIRTGDCSHLYLRLTVHTVHLVGFRGKNGRSRWTVLCSVGPDRPPYRPPNRRRFRPSRIGEGLRWTVWTVEFRKTRCRRANGLLPDAGRLPVIVAPCAVVVIDPNLKV